MTGETRDDPRTGTAGATMCPSTPPSSVAAHREGQHQGEGVSDSFQRRSSVADEDFAAACRGLQPKPREPLSPVARDRWRMIEYLGGGARQTRSPTRRAESPTSPEETPISMRMRKTINRLLPRVPSAPQAAAKCHAMLQVDAPLRVPSLPERDRDADKCNIQPHAPGMRHWTDEEEREHVARLSDASDRSAAGTPRSKAGACGAKSSTDACEDDDKMEPKLLKGMKTVWPASFGAAPLPQTHIKPSRHVSRLLHSSLLHQSPAKAGDARPGDTAHISATT